MDNIINDSNRASSNSRKQDLEKKNRQYLTSEIAKQANNPTPKNNFQIENQIRVRQVLREESNIKSNLNQNNPENRQKQENGNEQKRPMTKKSEPERDEWNKGTFSKQPVNLKSRIGYDLVEDEASESEFQESLDLESDEEEGELEEAPLKSLLESFRIGRQIC